jgi:type II secretory pathway predicted ATPase ExeA
LPNYHGLLFNPFYEKHDHRLVGEARKKQLNQIVEQVEKAVSANASYIVFLRGTVGVGKSFTLDNLTDQLISGKTFTNQKSVVATKFDATIGTPASKYIQYICTSAFSHIGKSYFSVLRKEFDTLISKTKKSPEDLLTGLDRDFKNAFLALRSNESLLWLWFTGEKVDLRDLKKVGVNSKIDTPTIALRVISSFCRLLRLLGYDGLVLCLDEAEELALAGPRKLVEMLTMIKKIFEQNKIELSKASNETAPIILCLGFTPETLDLIVGTELYTTEMKRTGAAGLSTFLRRIGEVFTLESFTNQDAEAFVAEILSKARKSTTKSCNPFTKKAIRYINSISRGIPGNIMEYCRECLEIADEKQADIDEENAKKWLVESGKIPETGLPEEFEEVEETEA